MALEIYAELIGMETLVEIVTKNCIGIVDPLKTMHCIEIIHCTGGIKVQVKRLPSDDANHCIEMLMSALRRRRTEGHELRT